MSVFNGISGVVNGQHTVRTWNVTTTADINPIYASNTKAAPIRLDGNQDWSGEFTAYGFQPVLTPGEFFKFQGSTDGTQGVTSEAGGAIVDTITINGDIEAGTAIEYTVAFSGNGTLIAETAAITDAVCPDIINSIGSYITTEEVGDATAEDTLSDVRTWSIVLSADNQSYVSSDTAGQTKRLAGNIDATISATIYEADFTEVIPPNTEKIVRIFAADGTYWEFQWILFNEDSGYEVDIEGATIVNYTLNGAFSGYTNISDVCTEGAIVQPDTTDLWP